MPSREETSGAQVEPGIAAAGAGSRGGGHAGGLRRRYRLDDLHVVHRLPALPGLRHRSRQMVAPVCPPVRRRRMGDLASQHRHPRAGQCAGDRARLRACSDDREGAARRRVLPHDLPLSARRLADRHRHHLAMDVQSRARRPEFPASARMGERRIQLARRSGAPPCTASSSPRSGTGSASTWR